MDENPKPLTRRQHTVPDFYLRQWAKAPAGMIACHDLERGICFETDPTNALARRYFYEEGKTAPDNRVERHLFNMEDLCSVALKKAAGLATKALSAANDKAAASIFNSQLGTSRNRVFG